MELELKEIDIALTDLLKDIDKQVAANSHDTSKFHTNLIGILSKFPKDKELIEFIVFINDRLETSQNINSEIIFESIRAVIKHKQTLIRKMLKDLQEKEQQKKQESKIVKVLNLIKENKVTVIVIFSSLTVIIALLSVIISPKETVQTLEELNKMRSNISQSSSVAQNKEKK